MELQEWVWRKERKVSQALSTWRDVNSVAQECSLTIEETEDMMRELYNRNLLIETDGKWKMR